MMTRPALLISNNRVVVDYMMTRRAGVINAIDPPVDFNIKIGDPMYGADKVSSKTLKMSVFDFPAQAFPGMQHVGSSRHQPSAGYFFLTLLCVSHIFSGCRTNVRTSYLRQQQYRPTLSVASCGVPTRLYTVGSRR